MMRLDKFLCEMGIGTRSEVKNYLKKGMVTVNGDVVKKPETKIDENKDIICYQGKTLTYEAIQYFLLNKPAGCVTATRDNLSDTVMSFLPENRRDDLFPVGRLDKDTEGLLLITNDGELGHYLLSPRHHIPKKYYVTLKHPVSDDEVRLLETGVDIGEKKITLPAKIESIDDVSLYITITEGKFHQIKRMFEAVNNKVIYLKRISMGPLTLDQTLLPGSYRRLTDEEITSLKNL